MKLRYLFSMILASALLFVGCVKEEPTDSFANIKLDKTMLVLPENGGTVQLTINSTEAWAFDTLYTEDVWPTVITRKKNDAGEYYVSKYETSWLTVDKLSGAAGETILNFTADTVAGGREIELCIKAGVNSQFLRVRQGSLEAQSATCADVIAGPDGKSYRVKGTVTSIVNTQYGNWYLNDGTGEVYIYGTLDKDGKTKNFASLGLEVGDVVEVEGPKTTYGTTVELVDVMVLSIQKSLVKVITEEQRYEKEGGEFDVKVAFKGDGLYPVVADTCKNWVSIMGVKTFAGTPTKIEPNPADTAVVTLSIAPFDEKAAPRTGYVTFTSASGKNSTEVVYNIVQKGDIPDPTPIKDIATVEYAYVEGTVVALCARGYVLADETGAMLIYYGSEYAGGHALGDQMGILGAPTIYNFASQISTIDFEQKLSEKPVEVKHPEAVVYDGAKVNELIASLDGKDKVKDALVKFDYVKMTGKLSVSGSNVNITIPGSEKGVGSLYYAVEGLKAADFDGKNVTVEGYVNGVSGGMYVNVVATAISESTGFLPELSLSKTSDTVEPTATEYSFNITSNLKWTLTASTGVTLDKTSGEGNATVKMTFAENETDKAITHTVTAKAEGAANAVLTLTQATAAAPTEATLTEFIAAAEDDTKYLLTGVICAMKEINTQYGNVEVTIKDSEGTELLIYRMKAAAEGPALVELGLSVGDELTVLGNRGSYKGAAQMINPVYVSHKDVSVVTLAEFIAAAEDDTLYEITGTITKVSVSPQYGNANLTITDGEGKSVEIFRMVPANGGKAIDEIGLDEGCVLTVAGVRSSYNGKIQMGKSGAYPTFRGLVMAE